MYHRQSLAKSTIPTVPLFKPLGTKWLISRPGLPRFGRKSGLGRISLSAHTDPEHILRNRAP